MRVEAWTDGANYAKKKPHYAGCGVVLEIRADVEGPILKRIEVGKFIGEGTNNQAEIAGIDLALSITELYVPHVTRLRVWTDSGYCKGLFWQHAPRMWRFTARKNRTAVQEVRKKILELEQTAEFVILWCKGHAGNLNNERADEIAKLCKMQQRDFEPRILTEPFQYGIMK